MSKSPTKRGPSCSRRTAPAGAREDVGVGEVGVVVGAARRCTRSPARRGPAGSPRPARRPRPRRRPAVLTCSASRSMPSSPASPRNRRTTTSPVGGGDPEVLVGQAAGQLDHGAREALQDRDAVQQGLQLDGFETVTGSVVERLERRPRRWCASGPVNHFLADTCHQIASTIRTPKVSDRRVVEARPAEVLVARARRRG